MLSIHHVARICHEANKTLCEAQGDMSQVSWNQAPAWQCESAIKGVQFCLDNPDAPPSSNHESWRTQKEFDGWIYGPVKDAVKKTHPCMVPYEMLPDGQKAKDHLFKNIVAAMKPFVGDR